MTFSQLKTQVLAQDWYLQAGAAKRLYISYPVYACASFTMFGRPIAPHYDVNFIMQPAFMDDFITKDCMRQIAEYYYQRERTEARFLTKLLAYWHQERVRPFLKFNERLERENLAALSASRLSKLLAEYSTVYRRLWQEAIFLDAYDYYGEIMFKQVQKRAARRLPVQELEILLAPPRASFLQQERLAVLTVAEKYRHRINYQLTAEFIRDIKKLSRRFHWLANDLAGAEYLGPEYYGERVKELVSQPSKLRSEQRMRRVLGSLSVRQQRIIKKYAVAREVTRLGTYLARLGNFRDERKTYNQMANSRLSSLAAELARRYQLTASQAEQLFFWELLKLPRQPAAWRSLARRREKQSAFYRVNGPGRQQEFFGRGVTSLGRQLKNRSATQNGLSGQPAYRGLVRGIARIIKDKNDFKKLRAGEILVAPNTRPEYVPIMKIAGAIISEEGGITCHAAITSRELRVPCVVGVQGVTAVLRDGDQVEVDVQTGRINLLKKHDI
jgi:phosphohistidine swiveling domain-containing protein